MSKKAKSHITKVIIPLAENVILNCAGVDSNKHNKPNRRRNKRIEVNIHNDDLSIDVHVHALYGYKIADAISYMQTNIASIVEEKTNYKVSEVNVYVDGFVEGENKQEQVQEEIIPKEKYGIIAISEADGLIKLFKECGADCVIKKNDPTIEDFIDTIKSLNVENVFIMPDSSMDYVSASKCKETVKDVNIFVTETKTIFEVINALNCFNREIEPNDNLHKIKEEVSRVDSYSFKLLNEDKEYENKLVKRDYYVAANNEEALVAGKNMKRTMHRLIDDLLEIRHKELLTIIVGKDADEKLTNKIIKYVKDYSDINIRLIDGKQSDYSYLFGIQ
ncbi:MAG: Asp23/Gls24 family envelope stress response protein [Firmicutes bacterium]|nr:Asp23/Gls24 family envelope stress response protein [Candidatus Colivicinus equi]